MRFLLTAIVLALSAWSGFAGYTENKQIAEDILPNLLRFSQTGPESSDLGDYMQFECTDEANGRSCQFKTTQLIPYVEGVAGYGAINVVGAIFLILGTAFYLFFLICVCICRRKKVHPAGVVPKPVDYKKQSKRFYYSYGCLGIFTIWLAILILIGTALGGQQMFIAISKVPGAANGAALIVHDELNGPVSNTVMLTASSVVGGLIDDLNGTITAGIGFNELLVDTIKLNDTIQTLPNFHQLQQNFYHIQSLRVKSKAEIANMQHQVSVMINSINATKYKGFVIQHDIGFFSAVMTNISAVINAKLPVCSQMADLEYDLFFSTAYPPSGLVNNVRDDFRTVPGTAWDTAKFSALTGSSAGSLTHLISGSSAGSTSELNLMYINVKDLNAEFAALPNYTNTRTQLLQLRTHLHDFDKVHGLGEQARRALLQIQEQLKLINTTVFIRHVDTFLAAVNALEFSKTNTSLSNLQDYVFDSSGGLSGILDSIILEVKKFKNISDILPIVEDIINVQSARFNKTIYQLPTSVSKIYPKVEKIVNTIADKVDVIIDPFSSGISALSSLDFQQYITTLSDSVDTLKKNIATFNRTKLVQQLNKFDSVARIDFEDYESRVTDLLDASRATSVPDSLLTLLNSLENSRKLILASTNVLVPQYDTLRKGFCASSVTTECTTDADCGGGVGSCSGIGSFRCSGASTACTQDSDCVSTCLASQSRATDLKNYIIAAAAIDYNSDNVVDKLNTLRFKLKGDPKDTFNYMSDAVDQIDSLDISTYQSNFDDVISRFDDVDWDSINSTLKNGIKKIDSIDLSKFNSTINNIVDKVDMVEEKIGDVAFILTGLVKFFYQAPYLKYWRNELNLPVLQQVNNVGGPGDVIKHVTNVFQEIQDYMLVLIRREKKDQKSVNMGKSTKDASEYLDQLTGHNGYNTNLKNGALYYLMSLNNATLKRMIPLNDPQSNAVTTNKDGKPYANGKFCLTNDCFKQTQLDVQNGGLTTIGIPMITQLASQVPLPTSFTMITVYLYVPIAIVALLALWTLLCPICTKKPHFRRCPATFSICCMICLLPWFFLITGLLFPFTIFLADVCATGANGASVFLSSYGDPACGKLGGTGTLNECVFKSQNITVDINVEAMFNGFLGDCGTSTSNDPFRVVGYAVADQIFPRLSSESSKRIKDQDKKNKIREKLTDNIDNLVENSADVFGSFLKDSVDDAINCAHIEHLLNDFKEPICVWFLGPLAWYLACVYLSAWTMCCVLIPGACLVQRCNTKLALDNQIEADLATRKAEMEADARLIAEETDGPAAAPPIEAGQNIYDPAGQQGGYYVPMEQTKAAESSLV